MSIRKVNFVNSEYYHIYNRGNSKQKIFYNEEDYQRFISLLYISNTKERFNLYDLNLVYGFNIYDLEITNPLVSVCSYCLMPNHFHILITEQTEGGISKFIHKVTTAYVMYFNKKYERTGSLFEGKFKSQHLDTDKYLKYMYSYIHLNPVKLIQKDWKEKGIRDKNIAIEYLNKYKYSSYLDFVGEKRDQNKILNINSFPQYFLSRENFKKEIFEWLLYNKYKSR